MPKIDVSGHYAENIENPAVKHTSYEPRCEKNRSSGFPTRPHTNHAVQTHKMARGLKFRIWEVEGSYYPFSLNKCADQLRSYCAADLRLCFRKCKKPVFS